MNVHYSVIVVSPLYVTKLPFVKPIWCQLHAILRTRAWRFVKIVFGVEHRMYPIE